jgi:hypothetical protein
MCSNSVNPYRGENELLNFPTCMLKNMRGAGGGVGRQSDDDPGSLRTEINERFLRHRQQENVTPIHILDHLNDRTLDGIQTLFFSVGLNSY